jgi:pyruvate,water dikinase
MAINYMYDMIEFGLDEENDLKGYKVWLCDTVHATPLVKPLYLHESWPVMMYSMRRTSEMLHLPTTKGWDVRFANGYPYLSIIETTEEERKQREPIFREKITPYIEDFGAQWNPLKAEIMSRYQELIKRAGGYEGIKRLSNIELLQLFDDFFPVDKRQWEIHGEGMVPAYYLFGLFEHMSRELAGFGPGDPIFGKLMAGFDSMLYTFNKELWRIADRARELGLAPLFQATEDNEQLLAKLEESDAGRKWLGEYREFLNVHGWRPEVMLRWETPGWIEKPSLGIPSLKIALTAGGVYSLDEKREGVVKEREEAEKEILAKVPAGQRDWFEKLMKAAQMAGYWSEDHTYYLDLYISALGRWVMTEYGRRFTEAGCIDDPEDVHYLLAQEIRRAAIPMERINLRPYVEKRKKEFDEYLRGTPAPFYGKIELAGEMIMSDPSLSVTVSVPVVREELKADLYGAASAPGIVEGVARVIMSQADLAELQLGEVLVAPATSAPWTPAFEIISGVITDGGGALSHPVIVAREYGIPCVAGCLEATKKIKTGDRVKIDGNLGAVYIVH